MIIMLFVNANFSGIRGKYFTRKIFYKRSFAKINTGEMQFFSTRENKTKTPLKLVLLRYILNNYTQTSVKSKKANIWLKP